MQDTERVEDYRDHRDFADIRNLIIDLIWDEEIENNGNVDNA